MRARSEQLKIDYPRLTVVSSVQESFVNLWSAAIRPCVCVCVCHFRERTGQFSHRLRKKLHSPHITPKCVGNLSRSDACYLQDSDPIRGTAKVMPRTAKAKVDLESQLTELYERYLLIKTRMFDLAYFDSLLSLSQLNKGYSNCGDNREITFYCRWGLVMKQIWTYSIFQTTFWCFFLCCKKKMFLFVNASALCWCRVFLRWLLVFVPCWPTWKSIKIFFCFFIRSCKF